LIIGKVFIDKNSNGRQDEGEEGLAGVELLTLDGRIITTDQYGRYHLFGSLVDGSSFVIKLLEDSLPEDMILVSENPKLIKISEGLMSKLNWLVK